MIVPNFVVLDSTHGRFIVNRHCSFQAETLVKTGATHIESELCNIFAILSTCSPGAVIIDGGANAGFFTIPVATSMREKNPRIISFEPQRELYRALSGSLVLNDIGFCELYNAGLGDQPGTAIVPPINYGAPQDFGCVQITQNGPGTPVEIITIDGLALDQLDFIKLDVEGYECAALVGGIQTIKKYRPYIWVEFFITGVDAIKHTLAGVPDYEFFRMDPQNMLCIPKESRSEINIVNADQL